MKHTHELYKSVALAVVVILVSSMATANADLRTYSSSYGPNTVGSAAGWAGASLAEFNSSLGTLTMVTLTLDSNTFAGVVRWDNEAGVASDVTLGIGAKVAINALGTLAVTTTIPMQTGSSSVDADNDGAPDYTGSDAFSVTGGSGSDSNSTSSTNAAVLALFTGTGTFDVWLSSSVSTLVSTTGGWGPSTTTAGYTDGTITVSYTYAPVPEPATVALLGLSSMVLGRKLKL